MRPGHDRPVRVLFLCLGNICRSPLAEGIFRQQVAAGLADCFEIASAGTGPWHVGQPPDRRTRASARRRGLDLDGLRGRQLAAADLGYYDHVLAMDRDNLHDALALGPELAPDPCLPAKAGGDLGPRLRLFREFDPEPDDYQVPDPYYGGADGFERVRDIVERTARALLARLRTVYGI